MAATRASASTPTAILCRAMRTTEPMQIAARNAVAAVRAGLPPS